MYPISLFFRKQAALYITLFFSCFAVFHSCKKNDLPIVQSHEPDFVKKFFTPKHPANEAVARVITKLKAENDRTGFVNKLPANCGLPVWEKLALQKKESATRNSFTAGDDKGDTTIILPMTNNDESLSAIITAIPDNDGYLLNCYTNNYLYNLCHATNLDTAYARKLLAFFFYVENLTFGTTTFYRIPSSLVDGPSLPDSNGTKTITIANVIPPTDGLVIGTVCIQITCPQSYVPGCIPNTVCLPVPGDGSPVGGGDGPGSGNTGTGTGGQSGGGSGGTGTGPGGGTTCPLTTNVTWYGLMPPPNPCGTTTPPTPTPTVVHTPCDEIYKKKNDTVYRAKFNDLKSKVNLDHESGYKLVSDASGVSQYQVIDGNQGDPEIDFEVYELEKTTGLIHSHFNSPKELSVFTPVDLEAVYVAKKGSLNMDQSSFSLGVVTYLGTAYMMLIEDSTQFSTFANNFLASGNFGMRMLGSMYEKYNIRYTNANTLNENNLLRLMRDLKMGLKLCRANSNFTDYIPLGLDENNNTKTIPCPDI